jgi:hypothetical protein
MTLTVQDIADVDETLDRALPIPSEKLPPGTEAPASATVKAWNAENFGVMFTIRDTDARSLFARMNGFLKVLKLEGWKPDWKNEVAPERVLNSAAAAAKPAPKCSIHGTPMEWKAGTSKKTGKPYAFYSCAQKLADGSYCNGKPMEEHV